MHSIEYSIHSFVNMLQRNTLKIIRKLTFYRRLDSSNMASDKMCVGTAEASAVWNDQDKQDTLIAGVSRPPLSHQQWSIVTLTICNCQLTMYMCYCLLIFVWEFIIIAICLFEYCEIIIAIVISWEYHYDTIITISLSKKTDIKWNYFLANETQYNIKHFVIKQSAIIRLQNKTIEIVACVYDVIMCKFHYSFVMSE